MGERNEIIPIWTGTKKWLLSKAAYLKPNCELYSIDYTRSISLSPRQRYVKTDFRTEKRNRLLFVGAIDFNTLPPKNARNRNNRFSKTEKIKSVAKMIFCS